MCETTDDLDDELQVESRTCETSLPILCQLCQCFLSTHRPVRQFGLVGSVASLKTAKQLDMVEGQQLAEAMVSALSAELAEFPSETLAELAQRLVRILDMGLWRAIRDEVLTRSELPPAVVVTLLRSFHSVLVKGDTDAVFAFLSKKAMEQARRLSLRACNHRSRPRPTTSRHVTHHHLHLPTTRRSNKQKSARCLSPRPTPPTLQNSSQESERNMLFLATSSCH